jgi:hypothetical protein
LNNQLKEIIEIHSLSLYPYDENVLPFISLNLLSKLLIKSTFHSAIDYRIFRIGLEIQDTVDLSFITSTYAFIIELPFIVYDYSIILIICYEVTYQRHYPSMCILSFLDLTNLMHEINDYY